MKELDRLDHALCISVLAAISEMPKNFGHTKTIGFLKWSQSRFVLQNKLQDNFFYGCFSLFNKKSLEKIIKYLQEEWLIETEKVGTFNDEILIISKQWLRVLWDRDNNVLNSGLFIKKNIEFKNKHLYNKLSELRYNLAKKNGLPTYCIFSNETIIMMTNEEPTNEDTLLQIKGVWKEKYNKYWEDFIKVIREQKHNQINEDDIKDNDSYISIQKKKYSNAYTTRSEQDDKRLKSLYEKWVTIKELSSIFERNNWGIRARLKKLWLID